MGIQSKKLVSYEIFGSVFTSSSRKKHNHCFLPTFSFFFFSYIFLVMAQICVRSKFLQQINVHFSNS